MSLRDLVKKCRPRPSAPPPIPLATAHLTGTSRAYAESVVCGCACGRVGVRTPAFAGYESLNRLQSRVFPTAYGTNENMLVCAPTGAGKTDVALMAILRELKQHVSGGRLERDPFKIVYVAPMKALAAEVVSKFSGRLKYLGVVVNELTGDMQLTRVRALARVHTLGPSRQRTEHGSGANAREGDHAWGLGEGA